jgi:hypothetical protein
VLDHTGEYIYVVLQNGGSDECGAYQTYKINSGGSFTFIGDSNASIESGGGVDVPSILGSETFAYADVFYGHESSVTRFQRASSGELNYLGALNDVTVSGDVNYSAYRPDASPVATGNYVVVQLDPNDANPPQFGVFTADSQGNLTLLPETKTNNGAIASAQGKQDPLSSGSVSYSNGTVVFTVTGALPNTAYNVVQTYTTILYSSFSYVIGGFTTNGTGNGSTSVNLVTTGSEGGDIFNMEGGNGAGYIGGFSIP